MKYDPKPFGRIVITQDGFFPTVVKKDVVDGCPLLCECWLSSAAEVFVGSTIHKPTIGGDRLFRTTDDAYNPTHLLRQAQARVVLRTHDLIKHQGRILTTENKRQKGRKRVGNIPNPFVND